MQVSADGDAPVVDVEGLVDLTSHLARFPSQIPNEGELGRFLADYMRASDCFDEVRLQPVVPGRFNVVGVVTGDRPGPRLLLNGHTDIPAPTGAWTRDPYDGAVADGRVYGLGLTDMKAAVACMVKAAEAVAERRASFGGELVVSAVIHHNVCGLGTKFFLDTWDRPFDAAINGEPTDLALQLAHGGAWQFQVTTFGLAKHSSRQGVNAIEKMLKLLGNLSLDALTYSSWDGVDGLPRLVLGDIAGGSSPSRTAERCVVKGDVRTVPGMTEDSLRSDLARLIARLSSEDPEFRAEVDGLSYQRPFWAEDSWEVVNLVSQAHEAVTGRPARVSRGLPMSAYVTDSSDLVRAGIPTVIYGPGDWSGEPDEFIAIDDLATASRVYADAALGFLAPA